MRTRRQRLAIAQMVLEAYRGSRESAYGRTSLSGIASKREPGEPVKTSHIKLSPEAQKKYDKEMDKVKERNRKGAAQARMRHKGSVPTKDGKPMFEDKNNRIASQQKWGKSLAGQTFYSICPDNDKYYKTIFIRFNPFTNAMQPMMSNAIYGTPPDGMEEINALILQRLMRLQQATTFEGF